MFFRYIKVSLEAIRENCTIAELASLLKKFKYLPKYLKAVEFKGGNYEKERSIFENLRKYVKDEWKDELCPNPATFIIPVRKHQACLDMI